MKRSLRHLFSARYWLLILLIIPLIAACDEDNGDENNTNEEQSTLFEWNRSADSIVLRADRQTTGISQAEARNRIPLCTLWGDGRLILLTEGEEGEVVTQAFLTDGEIRQLIENVIGVGFYSWESDLIRPDRDIAVKEVLTLNLVYDTRTIETYSDWPEDGFERIVEFCGNTAEQREIFLPNAAWISAENVPYDSQLPQLTWPGSAPFSLADIASEEAPRWLEGGIVTYVWQGIRETPRVQFRDNNQAYQITISVPHVSRDSLPAPE